uniref:NADH dehydrogenase subunit 6 n=1 Tax=Penicillidia dufourii TaxID=1321409 RepID=UPI002551FACD|nr:NADH dehydrogenase subunit 6 [Penicillidia dufourii]WGH14998.1 NADH dehydrogenase subunit 6 [Penicillidia dufourii]
MQWFLLFILFSLNFMFFIIKHPLTMSLILLIQTFMISIMSGMMNKNFWFSYILFLIFIGALLILFIYITSLTSNKLFNFSYNMIFFPLIFFLLYLLMNPNFYNWNFFNSDMFKINELNLLSFNYEFIMLFNFPSNMIILMIMIYLLLTLISIMKITKFNKGPFRMMN